MVKIIRESGMNFIADNIFHIEKSDIYVKLKDKGIKSVEFIRVKDDKLLFVEAKSSFPNSEKSNPDNPENFNNQINGICDKFVHSLNLYSSIKTGVNETIFPNDFKPVSKASLDLVLIINHDNFNKDKKLCIHIKKELINQLRKNAVIDKIWKPGVRVMNREFAIKENLIINGGA